VQKFIGCHPVEAEQANTKSVVVLIERTGFDAYLAWDSCNVRNRGDVSGYKYRVFDI
jgi:hypothetical protein